MAAFLDLWIFDLVNTLNWRIFVVQKKHCVQVSRILKSQSRYFHKHRNQTSKSLSMDLSNFIKETIRSIGQSFHIPYNHMKWYCKNAGYNISEFDKEIRRTLLLMYSNMDIKLYWVNKDGYTTVEKW